MTATLPSSSAISRRRHVHEIFGGLTFAARKLPVALEVHPARTPRDEEIDRPPR